MLLYLEFLGCGKNNGLSTTICIFAALKKRRVVQYISNFPTGLSEPIYFKASLAFRKFLGE
jgi:hypothetical protein